MGAIKEACQANGLTLDIFAAYMNMNPGLLKGMDSLATSMPGDLSEKLADFVSIREDAIESFCKSLQMSRLSQGYVPKVNAIVVYRNHEDFAVVERSAPRGVNYLTHRHMVSVLASRLAPDIQLTMIDFDRNRFDAWRGDNEDTLESRALWGAAEFWNLQRENSGKN